MGVNVDIEGFVRIDRPLDPRTAKKIRKLFAKDQLEPSMNKPFGSCHWKLLDDDRLIVFSCDKAGDDAEWLQFIIDKYLAPKDYVANGRFLMKTDYDDLWSIAVVRNKVTMKNILPARRS